MTFLTYTVLQAITEILLNIWLKTPHLELYKNKSLSLEKSNERGKIMMAALVFNDL